MILRQSWNLRIGKNLLILAFTLSISGCTSFEGPTSTAEIRVAETSPAFEPTIKPFQTVTPESKEAKIAVDGDCDDFADEFEILADWTASTTFSTVLAVMDTEALLLCVDDPVIDVSSINLQLSAGDDRIGVEISDNFMSVVVEDRVTPISGELSRAVLADDVEVVLAVQDLGLATGEPITLISICMNPESSFPACFNPVDAPEVPGAFLVDISDPGARVIQVSALAETFHLPPGYDVELLIPPAVGELFTVAVTEDRTIFAQSFSQQNHGVHVYDDRTGKIQRLLDGSWFDIFEGPGDTIFAGAPDGTTIWQLRPDGSHLAWGSRNNFLVFPMLFTDDGRMYGNRGGHSVIELFPEGTHKVLADGFEQVFSLVKLDDGALVISDFDTGNITRIETSGQKRTIASNLVSFDAMYMKQSPGGSLFINTPRTGFAELDPETGSVVKRFPGLGFAGNYCLSGIGFSFLDESHVVFASLSTGSIIVADLGNGTTSMLVEDYPANTRLAIGADDALYAGTSVCEEVPTNQIVRIHRDGTRSVLVGGLDGETINDVDFASDQGIYLLLPEGRNFINHIPPGADHAQGILESEGRDIRSIALHPANDRLFLVTSDGSTLLESAPQGMIVEYALQLPEELANVQSAFAPDGTLYLTGSDKKGNQSGPTVRRYLLRVDLQDSSTETVFLHERPGCCAGFPLTTDAAGNIWILDGNHLGLLKITPLGEVGVFATKSGLGTDALGIAISKQGEIFVAGPNGVFRIFAGS